MADKRQIKVVYRAAYLYYQTIYNDIQFMGDEDRKELEMDMNKIMAFIEDMEEEFDFLLEEDVWS